MHVCPFFIEDAFVSCPWSARQLSCCQGKAAWEALAEDLAQGSLPQLGFCADLENPASMWAQVEWG